MQVVPNSNGMGTLNNNAGQIIVQYFILSVSTIHKQIYIINNNIYITTSCVNFIQFKNKLHFKQMNREMRPTDNYK